MNQIKIDVALKLRKTYDEVLAKVLEENDPDGVAKIDPAIASMRAAEAYLNYSEFREYMRQYVSQKEGEQ